MPMLACAMCGLANNCAAQLSTDFDRPLHTTQLCLDLDSKLFLSDAMQAVTTIIGVSPLHLLNILH